MTFKRVYLRVSTEDQSVERQLESFKGILIEGQYKIYEEKASGKEGSKRPVFKKMLSDLKPGDEILVHAVDRFGRSIGDFASNMKIVKKAEAGLHIFNTNLRFDENPISNAIIHILMVFAELERDMISERIKGAMALAKRDGKMKGRKPKICEDEVKIIIERRAKGQSFAVIGKKLGVSNMSVLKALRRYEAGTLNANKEHWDAKAEASKAAKRSKDIEGLNQSMQLRPVQITPV